MEGADVGGKEGRRKRWVGIARQDVGSEELGGVELSVGRAGEWRQGELGSLSELGLGVPRVRERVRGGPRRDGSDRLVRGVVDGDVYLGRARARA